MSWKVLEYIARSGATCTPYCIPTATPEKAALCHSIHSQFRFGYALIADFRIRLRSLKGLFNNKPYTMLCMIINMFFWHAFNWGTEKLGALEQHSTTQEPCDIDLH